MSRESPDGKWLYFTRIGGNSIWRMPKPEYGRNRNFSEELVVGPPYKVQTEGWDVTTDEIFFIDRPTKARAAAIRAFRPETRQSRKIMDLTEVFPDRGDITLSVSPKPAWIMYSQFDRSGSNVFVGENMHY